MPGQNTHVILTHENADFDAVAALVGAAKLYPDALPVLPRKINRNVRHFLTLYGADLPLVQAEELRGTIERVTLVDTQSAVTLKGMSKKLRVQIIDHHTLARELKPGWRYSGEQVGAVTTLLVEQIIAQGCSISPIEATLFLLGIYEDTGSLSYQTTTPRDVRCVAWLLEQGARLDIADDFLHYPLNRDQRELYELLLRQSETFTFAGQSVVIATAHFPRYVEEVSVLAPKLRDLLEPTGLFLLVHFPSASGDDGQIQLIARSSSDALDVAQIAAALGGGGHSRAAAALIRGQSLEQVKARLLELLAHHVRPSVTVRQIMSFGVRTVRPQTTVAEAAELMQRYGHEGFPVVDDGRVVGVLARREVDRAMRLGLGSAAVSLYMTKGAIQVHPDDALETLQRVMVEHGVGQVPVVAESGEILGIVTRTDLIRSLLGTWNHERRTRRAEVSRKLREMVGEKKMALLWQAADLAHELGYTLYIVGGFVRDLLLGRPNQDIDLVVEGDAIALAKKLARQLGGRVRAHARFGTAKWILNGESLDFVTARTEFYEHPTALPQVERSSIKQDLHRRDFTINTLAIRLDRDRYGELLDFYGGEQDLRDGVIRVLHSLSFVEDPTRILRAIRLEQRLGFRIEPRTQELIDHAAGLLARVSGERIRHELFLLLQEPEPEAGLLRMEALDVLRHIHPGLRCDGWVQRKFRTLREVLPQWKEELSSPIREELPRLYLAILCYRLLRPEVETLSERLSLPRDDARLLDEVVILRDSLAPLQTRSMRPSEVYHLLSPYSPLTILVTWVATDSSGVRDHLERYQRIYRHVTPALNGNDLRAMGLPPGPLFRHILDALRDARLDGEISSEEEERALVPRLAARLEDTETA